jgi:hypothetical protein
MRHRAAVVALLALLAPSILVAQRIRLPRGKATGPTVAPLPPEIPAVSRALAFRRSRLATEGYTMVSSMQLPTGTGTEQFTMIGAGTHAAYRYTDNFSATLDITSSLPTGTANSQTVEAGFRYSPMSLEARIRPFVDGRAGYARLTALVSEPTQESLVSNALGGPSLVYGSRYSRGVGGIAGAGFDFALTRSIAITSEMLAMRDRMSTYRWTGSSTAADKGAYSMTSYRFIVGLRFNPVRALHLAQNPNQ